MEVSTLTTTGAAGMRGPTPLLRLASDERLVALTRKGNQGAFEALVARYQARLLAFCRHMLNSREDAEDVLQEVFAASFNAMIADERPINVRPWLYRIARNRSLNHLRRATAVGVDSMDVHMAEHGTTTAEKAHSREEFRMLMADVQTLPETQRTALLLREIDALSYEQIAEAMDTTIPSVKSLLVRARVSLAEMSEARDLSCEDVRDELGEVAEGIRQRMSPPVRRHLRGCERCSGFRKQLRNTNKALAAVFPIGPLLFLKKTLLAQLGTTSAGGAAVGAGSAAAATGAAGGALGAVASKTVAGLTAAAIVTAGAVEVQHSGQRQAPRPLAPVAITPPAPPVVPEVVANRPQPDVAVEVAPVEKAKVRAKAAAAKAPTAAEDETTGAAPVETAAAETPPAPTTPAPAAPAEGSDVTTMPAHQPAEQGTGQPAPQPSDGSTQTSTTPTPAPAPQQQSPAPAEQSPAPAEQGQEQPPPAETTPEPAPAG